MVTRVGFARLKQNGISYVYQEPQTDMATSGHTDVLCASPREEVKAEHVGTLYDPSTWTWAITRAEMLAWDAMFCNAEMSCGPGAKKYEGPEGERFSRVFDMPSLFTFLQDHLVPADEQLPEQKMTSAELVSRMFLFGFEERCRFRVRAARVMKKCKCSSRLNGKPHGKDHDDIDRSPTLPQFEPTPLSARTPIITYLTYPNVAGS
jgi:hypothetical protein